jgi:hypothetical protein
MTRPPVTLADQSVVLEPEDADELTDLLADAAWVIGSLAGQRAAEDAAAAAPGSPDSCEQLAIELRLAAAGLEEAAAAGQHNTYMTGYVRTAAGPAAKQPRHAPENKRSGEGNR